jgi:hypothetical protein
MRRLRILLALALALAAAAPARAQQTNGLTKVFVVPLSGDCDTTPCSSAAKSLCRESTTSTVIYACDTGTGFYIPVASGAEAGAPLNLEGNLGDTYLTYDANSRQVQVYVNGSLRARITANGVIPGYCPANAYAFEGGTECFDRATGKVVTRTVRGLVKQ